MGCSVMQQVTGVLLSALCAIFFCGCVSTTSELYALIDIPFAVCTHVRIESI
jgi:hypothetical protein